MKRKPIIAKHLGCGCSINYQVLPREFNFNGMGIHIHTLFIDDKSIELKEITLEKVFEKYKEDFESAYCIEISIMTPLHDETYELCKRTGEFLLVEQGEGYA